MITHGKTRRTAYKSGYIRCSVWGKQWNPKNSWCSNKTRAHEPGTFQTELSSVARKLISAVDYASLVQAASAPLAPPPPPPPPRDIHKIRTKSAFSDALSLPFRLWWMQPSETFATRYMLCRDYNKRIMFKYLNNRNRTMITSAASILGNKKKVNLSLCPITWPWWCIRLEVSCTLSWGGIKVKVHTFKMSAVVMCALWPSFPQENTPW